jgi:hypothetical protein
MTTRPAIFKWRQTEPQLILCAICIERSIPRELPLTFCCRRRGCCQKTVLQGSELRLASAAARQHGSGAHLHRGDPGHQEGRDSPPSLSPSTRPILEQHNRTGYRAIKRRVNAKQGFREFHAARRTIQGYEAINMIHKGQVRWVRDNDVRSQIRFIEKALRTAHLRPEMVAH